MSYIKNFLTFFLFTFLYSYNASAINIKDMIEGLNGDSSTNKTHKFLLAQKDPEKNSSYTERTCASYVITCNNLQERRKYQDNKLFEVNLNIWSKNLSSDIIVLGGINKNIGSTFKQNAGGRREEISDATKGFEMLIEKLRSSPHNIDRFYIIESNDPQIGITVETLNKSLRITDYAIVERLPGGTGVLWPATCKVWTPLSID